MIVVDSGVWIDYFRNHSTPQTEWLDRNLSIESLIVADLILAEVLRGFTSDIGFEEARRLLLTLEQTSLGGTALAIESARNFRRLRARGITVRGTVDVLIATHCIAEGYRLLHSDRDFEGFAQHLGLHVVDCSA